MVEMKTYLNLEDDNEEDDGEIKALVDWGADLIEMDDTLSDEEYALDKVLNLFLPIYHSCKGLMGFLF